MTTLAPPPDNSSAMALPRPLLAPVTTTTASFKVPTLSSFSRSHVTRSLLTREIRRKSRCTTRMAHIDRWSPNPFRKAPDARSWRTMPVEIESAPVLTLAPEPHKARPINRSRKNVERLPTSRSSPTRPFRKKIRFGLRCTAYLCSTYSYSRSTTMSGSEAVQRRVGILDDERYIQSEWPVRALTDQYIYVKCT